MSDDTVETANSQETKSLWIRNYYTCALKDWQWEAMQLNNSFSFFSHMSHSWEGLLCCHFNAYIIYISKRIIHKKCVTKLLQTKIISLFKLCIDLDIEHHDILDWCNFYDTQITIIYLVFFILIINWGRFFPWTNGCRCMFIIIMNCFCFHGQQVP